MKNVRKWGVNPNRKPKTVEFSEWKDECHVKCQFDELIDMLKELAPSKSTVAQFLLCVMIISGFLLFI